MIPQRVAAVSVATLERVATVRPGVVGDPRATLYRRELVDALDEDAYAWFGLRALLVQAQWMRKREDGTVGFTATARVFPGL